MSTYTPIASVTLSSAQSSVTFSGIPQTYTDLVVVGSMRSDTTTFNNMNFPQVQFNGDTGSTYSNTTLYSRNTGGGWSALSTRSSNTDGINSGGIATTSFGSSIFSTYIVNVMNYTNTTTNKTVIARVGTGGDLTNMDGTSANVGLWRNTAAITSLRIVASSSGNFVSGSTFNLYGVANASITNVAKATGGDSVYTDGTYWYHIFRSSGTFTPTQALTADYLVVAGGGGGGGNTANTGAGGGGAGGMRCTVTATGGGGSLESALSLTAQAYTVTVGAGGAGGNQSETAAGGGVNGSNSVFSTITSTGGGGGAYGGGGAAFNTNGNGGSGGGINRFGAAAGTGTANQGYAGAKGVGADNTQGGGGGGGAGATGSTNSGSTGGAGGTGVATSISATSTTYAGGGGGGAASGGTGGSAGSGGGGQGGNSGNAGAAGTTNTGGGGGAGGSGGNGGAGGSGIVIVRYSAA